MFKKISLTIIYIIMITLTAGWINRRYFCSPNYVLNNPLIFPLVSKHVNRYMLKLVQLWN